MGAAVRRRCIAIDGVDSALRRARVAAFDGGRRVERVGCDGTRVEADLVVVGIGVRPAIEWLASSGLALDDGVVCDATCATSRARRRRGGRRGALAPPAFERGDARRTLEPRGRDGDATLRAGCSAEPRSASRSRRSPYFWSDQYDVKIQFAGELNGVDALAVIEDAADARKLVVLFGRAGRLSGVLTWNRPALLVRYRRAITDGLAWDVALAQARG